MGVLQFCPDVEGAFRSMLPFLRPGGEIVVDVYEKASGLPPLKTFVRPFTKRMGAERLYKLLCWTIPPAFDTEKGDPPGSCRRTAAVESGSHRSNFARRARLELHGRRIKTGEILSALNMLVARL